MWQTFADVGERRLKKLQNVWVQSDAEVRKSCQNLISKNAANEILDYLVFTWKSRPRYIRERALQRTRTINFNYHPLSAAQNVVVLLSRSRTTKLWVDPTQRRRSSSSFWFSLWRATWPFAFLPICRERSARTAISPAGLHRFSNSKLKSRYVFQVDL